jgi:hypothetical protein
MNLEKGKERGWKNERKDDGKGIGEGNKGKESCSLYGWCGVFYGCVCEFVIFCKESV